MSATCNCIAEIDEKLAPHNGELLVTLWPVHRPTIETQKRDTKKRGKVPLVVATYCPFCGEKYPEHSA